MLTPDDTDKLAGETLAALTDKTVAVLRTVVAESRESRDRPQSGRGSGGIGQGHAGVHQPALPARPAGRGSPDASPPPSTPGPSGSKLGGTEAIRRDHILAAVGWLSRALFWLLAALLAYTWLARILARFPYTGRGAEPRRHLLGVLREGSVSASCRRCPTCSSRC